MRKTLDQFCEGLRNDFCMEEILWVTSRSFGRNQMANRENKCLPKQWEALPDSIWPKINSDHKLVKYLYPVPNLEKTSGVKFPLNGNFVLRDDFNDSLLADY